MRLYSRFVLLAFLFLFPLFSFSQADSSKHQSQNYSKPKPKNNIMNRIYIGGYLSLSFGTVTYIAIAPQVGYRFTNNLTAGVGFNYQYYQDNYYNYHTNVYGGLIFARYNVYKGLFLEGDFEDNNLDVYNVDINTGNYFLTRQWVPSLLLGGGYSGGGSHGGFYISILYDVLQNPNSPYYGIPVIRAGVGFGI
ncbi:MAG: hypothetical protein ACHQD9_07875 [Chitinophagales bacterium]